LAVVLPCARLSAADEPRAEAPKSAAELLPTSTLAYFEISRPKDVIDLVLDHPLRALVEQAPDFRKALESPQFKEARSVLSAVEQRAGVQWRPALEQITGGGVAFGFETGSQGVVMLVRPDDPKTADRVRDAIF